MFTLFNVPGKDKGFNFLIPVVPVHYNSKQMPVCQNRVKETLREKLRIQKD